MRGRRRDDIFRWFVVLLVMVAWIGTGCDSEMAKDFRSASRAQLESGVDTVVDGLLDGLFSLWDPDTSSS